MGLSAYGKPKYYDDIKKMIDIENDGNIRINQRKWKYNIYKRNYGIGYKVKIGNLKKRNEGEELKKVHFDLASSVQTVFNEIATNLTKKVFEKFNSKNLCLAGGVAQNILMNQKIYLDSGFKNIFVQPASHDAGTSLGAALLALEKNGHLIKEKKFTALQGQKFSNDEIKKLLDSYGISSYKPKNIYNYAAKLISKGNVVGWFHGRTEFGQELSAHEVS